ncbi:hypothetical protein LSH36_561g02059 [Paralvinella palmiformis]|uniref:PHF7/G2E3-like PHD zinc finger domain-containing protein n=1 Tax=Paralvinella palmiformis TaxID=53620 RepID=A0AAD9J7U7_9ANNE|nr:hypothetical protein LSH36_561g02059 [Paralvinella palmiformis]
MVHVEDTHGDNLHTVSWQTINQQFADLAGNMLALIDVVLCIPATSVEAEQGFSVMKRLFASGLSQNGSSDKEGIMGFLPHDIMKEVRRAARLNHAVSSGLHFFRCPLCNDKDIFQKEMLKFGIYIPDHKWEVVLCDWCGSSGTHIACSRLKGPSDDWICKDCFQICGKDKTKGKKKADSCPKVVERPKSRPSIDHTPSNSKKRQRSKLDSFGEGRKSRKRSRLVTERKDVGRSVLQRRYSQWMNEEQSNSENADQPDHLRFSDEAAAECRSHPSPTVPRWYRRLMSEDILTGKNLGVKYLEQYHELFGPQISDHVVLGSRLNDWTPEERKLGYQAQLHLTKMTHDTIVKAKAALSRRARKTVGYHQICIEQAFSRKNDIKNNTKDGANQRRSGTISDCVRNVFSKFTKGLKTDAALLNSDAPILMNGGRDVVKPDSAIIMDAKNEAVKHSGAMVDCIKEAVVSESAVQMVAPGGKPSAAEFADVPCNIAAAEADNSSSTGVNAGAMIQSANVPDIDLEAGDKAHFAGSEVLATVTNTLCGSVKRAIIRLHPTGLSPAKKHVNVKPMKRSLSYPEFVNKYFETSHPSVLAKVMYYQDYLRKGLLPDFLNSTAY